MASRDIRPVQGVNQAQRDPFLLKLAHDMDELTAKIDQYAEASAMCQQRPGQYHTGNPYYNIDNHGWNCQPNFRREEGNNYGFPYYQWEPSSHFGIPSPPNLTVPIQHSPPSRSDDFQLIFKGIEDLKSQIANFSSRQDKHLEEMSEIHSQWSKHQEDNGEKLDGLGELADLISSKFLPKDERMEEEHDHLHDRVMQLVRSINEQQVEVNEPLPFDNLESFEEDSEDEGDAINQSPLLNSFEPSEVLKETKVLEYCPCGADELCKVCQEVDDWLATPHNATVLELVEDKGESSIPPLPTIEEQLETKIEKSLAPFVDFVIPSHTFHCIYDYISFCDIGVEEKRTEEQANQREGNIVCSLQRRRLLPLWIFKENLKPD